ncbi:helix-turn-helix domain-containing protein [Streptomyces sp. NPDC057298]|uniref:helix-turn-helix domain-containing protein n=1 Tax=Streptomyces sp. NPDC057298 TaxID=3346091 RepID=UPI0036416169
MRAGEMLERGCTQPEVARAVGVCLESVRRWKRGWEQDGTPALRRRPAGRPPKLDDAQAAEVRQALEQGAQAHGFEAGLWTRGDVGPGPGMASADRSAGVESAAAPSKPASWPLRRRPPRRCRRRRRTRHPRGLLQRPTPVVLPHSGVTIGI